MDSNVENILRNMVDGTTEYDPPHSRVEKLLIELKEALDAGGGGGTVDDVARNRINTHIDNSNVHVSTAEKSSWNAKAEQSDFAEHTGNAFLHTTQSEKEKINSAVDQNIFNAAVSGFRLDIGQLKHHANNADIHVTASEKAAWSAKAELSDIPERLQYVNYLGYASDVENILNNTNYSDSAYECVITTLEAAQIGLPSCWWQIKYFRHTDNNGFGIQIAFPIDGPSNLPRYRTSQGGLWDDWKLLADGGNSDTVDGLHANEIASNPNLLINPDFAVNQRGITSASGGTSTVYIADRWFSQRAIISRPENGGISIAWDGTNKDNGWVQQKIETAALFGKTVTISADIDGELKSVTTIVPTLANKTDGDWVDSDKKVMFAVSNLGGTLMSIVIFSYTTTPITISNVKLELGANTTRYYPPDPATELAKCQRYYQRIAAYLPSRAAGISTDFIDFVYNLSVPMMSKPSVDLSAFDVYSVNYSKQTGFDSSINIISNNFISIRATKTGHGLADAIARPSAVLELSAEL